MKRILMLTALLIIGPAQAADDKMQKVFDCMRANLPMTLRVQEIELAATDRSGSTRVLQGKLYSLREKGEKGGNLLRTMLRLHSPQDLAGAAYLVREADDFLKDGMYVYLPSVRRVRRVSGTFADGALLGTNFSYNDFKEMETVFAGADATLQGEDHIDDRAVHVIQFKSPASEKNRYSSVRTWVDQKTCVPLKMEFYEGDKPRKRLSAVAGALQKVDGYWYLSEIHMRDLMDGTGTVMRTTGVSAGKDIPSSTFDPAAFYLGK